MKGILICCKGIERVAGQEIEELTGSRAEISETALVFPVRDREDLAKLCYRSQSAIKVLQLLDNIKIGKDFAGACESIRKSIEKIDFSGWLDGRTFKVRCRRIGDHDFSGQDISVKAGEYVIGRTRAKAAMVDPDMIIYIYIYQDDCYIGIDYSGFDLSKRDYRVFTHPDSLNSTVAYSLARTLGYKKGTMIDPFSGSGVIPIEAALYIKGMSPHHFKKDKFAFHHFLEIDLDKFDVGSKPDAKIIASDHVLRFVRSIKNNAKLAGADDIIDVKRMDIEWLDTKLDEGSVDMIISHPPSASKMNDEKAIEKLYKEFFYQAEYVLKKSGKIALCVRNPDVLKRTEMNFKVTGEFSIWQGQQELHCMTLMRA